jgi:hypothetical protein
MSTFGVAVDATELLRGRTVAQNMELLVVFCIAGRRQPMTFGGSGALNDYHGRGHRVFGMRSHVTIHVCMALPLRSVATITGYMAQIPGVLDRIMRQNDISETSAVGFISFLPESQDFAAKLEILLPK